MQQNNSSTDKVTNAPVVVDAAFAAMTIDQKFETIDQKFDQIIRLLKEIEKQVI